MLATHQGGAGKEETSTRGGDIGNIECIAVQCALFICYALILPAPAPNVGLFGLGPYVNFHNVYLRV